jgi:hypothetical protein
MYLKAEDVREEPDHIPDEHGAEGGGIAFSEGMHPWQRGTET